jgi:hypothetical protein
MNGGQWGELIRADIDRKGNVWVFHRCFNTVPAGTATCVGRSEPPILEFDPSGKLLASFGGGMFAFPHGFTVDAQGNVWASDANASATVLGISSLVQVARCWRNSTMARWYFPHGHEQSKSSSAAECRKPGMAQRTGRVLSLGGSSRPLNT